MVRTLEGLVVAIPAAGTVTGQSIGRLVAAEQGELILGSATASQVKSLEASIQPGEIAYVAHVDLERAKSVDEFIKIAIGQFGRVDAIVLETKFPRRASQVEKSIGVAVRRLLYCLNSALRYCAGDLHLINISPEADRYAIPVASAFLGSQLATRKPPASSAPTVRMSVLSPPKRAGSDDGTLVRTVLHVLRESRNVDVTETVLLGQPHASEGRSQLTAMRSKLMWPM